MLPLIYLALIGLVGWLTYLHAVHNTGLLTLFGSSRLSAFSVAAYLGLAAAGGITILFLIKPLFARSAKRPVQRALERSQEPLLFALVDRICEEVDSVAPRRIEVDCQVNAAASFRRGWWSMLTGNDLVLTIGLPLAGGLDVQQFAGVLAHEMGHFSQGAGMRLSYIVRSINAWFIRVVYERDIWDERLAAWAQNANFYLAVALQLARLCILLTRQVLRLLMLLGHIVAGYLLRQMEYNADRYEIRLAGSDAFATTARRIALLSVATEKTFFDVNLNLKEGHLGNDIPKLILANARHLPDAVKEKLAQLENEQKAELGSTHPTDRDRIAAAQRENAHGIFHDTRPATILFSDFDRISMAATMDLYWDSLGNELSTRKIVPSETLLDRNSADRNAETALNRYFQGHFNSLRPLLLPQWVIEEPSDPQQTAAALRRARQAMLDACEAYGQVYAKYDAADTIVIASGAAETLYRAGGKWTASDPGPPMRSADEATAAKNNAEACLRKSATELAPFERSVGERLSAALTLLYVPQAAAQIESSEERQKEVDRILPALAVLTGALHDVCEVRNVYNAINVLFGRLEKNPRNQAVIAVLTGRIDFLYGRLASLRERFTTVEYPSALESAPISLGEYLLKIMPHRDDPGGICYAAGELLSSLHDLYPRLVGRLTAIAETVESLLGLPPLPEPPPAPAVAQPPQTA